MILEALGGILFLLVGICGCIYPFIIHYDKHITFNKSDSMFTDGDNT